MNTTAELTMRRVSPQAAAAGGTNAAALIDVRTAGEYNAVHASGAQLAPLSDLDPAAVMNARTGNGPIYLICKSGQRAAKAAEKFVAAGFPDVVVVEGGTDAWVAAGLPVVRGRGAISLERQVRIVAGFLVLTGVVLALTVNLWFAGISGFVGAGLMFAGITDTCGMGMLLARMPWNRSACSTCARK